MPGETCRNGTRAEGQTVWGSRGASYAVQPGDWLGREYAEPEHTYRHPFQRDRDRVVHCAAFRRLQGKMQVFTGDFGDYHRTRLTHTLEVVSIARTMARALHLNEDLVEALALLHDIGHPPFGHAGEDVLNAFLRDAGGFNHNSFALQLVRETERRSSEFPGLNLSRNILNAQRWRADKSTTPPCLECQIVDLADSIAYNAHDLDDSLQMGLLEWDDVTSLRLVAEARDKLSPRDDADLDMRRRAIVRQLIDDQVTDLIAQATRVLQDCQNMQLSDVVAAGIRLGLSNSLLERIREMEQFLFRSVYRHPQVMAARHKAQRCLQELLDASLKDQLHLPADFQQLARDVGPRQAAVRYFAGMTDQNCLLCHETLISSRKHAP